MSGHHVIAFHESLHRELPVHRQPSGEPPFGAESLDVPGIMHARKRLDGLTQRRRIVIEVDEGTPAPRLEPTLPKRKILTSELVLLEQRRRVDELALAIGLPLPAVERT